MYRLPGRTKFNAEYNADYNAEYNTDYNTEYNTEYNATSVLKLHHREFSRMTSPLRLGDPKLYIYDDN